jgi:hypothetical protein
VLGLPEEESFRVDDRSMLKSLYLNNEEGLNETTVIMRGDDSNLLKDVSRINEITVLRDQTDLNTTHLQDISYLESNHDDSYAVERDIERIKQIHAN